MVSCPDELPEGWRGRDSRLRRGRLASSQPFSAILRFSDVAASQAALESALGSSLDRYEPAREGPLHYAQFDIAVGNNGWEAITDCIQRIGPQMAALRQDGLIGSTTIDLAVSFDENKATLFVKLPSHAAETVGRYGIDIEFSVYRTADDE
jgi:hypothetical protein